MNNYAKICVILLVSVLMSVFAAPVMSTVPLELERQPEILTGFTQLEKIKEKYDYAVVVYFHVSSKSSNSDYAVGDLLNISATVENIGKQNLTGLFSLKVFNPSRELLDEYRTPIVLGSYDYEKAYRTVTFVPEDKAANMSILFSCDIAGDYKATVSIEYSSKDLIVWRWLPGDYVMCDRKNPKSIFYSFDVMPLWEKRWRIKQEQYLNQSIMTLSSTEQNIDRSTKFLEQIANLTREMKSLAQNMSVSNAQSTRILDQMRVSGDALNVLTVILAFLTFVLAIPVAKGGYLWLRREFQHASRTFAPEEIE